MKRALSNLAAALALPSCHGDSGPTAPEQRPLELSGSWHGDVHFKSPVSFYYDDGSCPDQPVTVSIHQQDLAIGGTIRADCVTAQFEATIGPSLRVASGTATQNVGGISYTATLTLNPVIQNGQVTQMGGSTTPFTSSTGGQRDSIVLTLSR